MTLQVTVAQASIRGCRWAAVTAVAAMAALTALSADASAKRVAPAGPSVATAERQAGEPIMAVVSIKSQQVTFYDADGWIFRAPVSSGTKGRETPAGIFSVLEKDLDHHSSLYDDASMPNMQRLTWNGIALHGGPLPGYAASHGCVRMPYDFAKKVFDLTRIGMRVVISPDDAAPADFSHPALIEPSAEALAAAPARAESLQRESEEAAKAADEAAKAAAKAVRVAAPLTTMLKKLQAAKTRADADLAYYPDQSFDYAILSETLQTMMRPDKALEELLRIGRLAVVSFPNFAHWRVRLSLLWGGRMPVTRLLPIAWYETPNIHHLTLADFKALVAERGIKVERAWFLSRDREIGAAGANWRAEHAIYLLSR